MRRFAPIVFLLGLAACATGPAKVAWEPRADADLSRDEQICKQAAAGMDISSYGGQAYSDGRYGAAAAMANRLDRDSIRGGGANAVYQAVFEDCMKRRGWTKAIADQ